MMQLISVFMSRLFFYQASICLNCCFHAIVFSFTKKMSELYFPCYHRYEEGHAIRHWKDTQHCYSLDMETQRVWDYVGDNYVHRLNQSRSDNKLAKLNSNSRPSGKNCIPCGCSDDVGISEAILSSKVQMVSVCLLCLIQYGSLHNL